MRLALTASPGLQVGKTTLIKSLVKHYTRHNISAVKGPVTVVSGKHRRLQFVECGSCPRSGGDERVSGCG